jgi:hypothetical protein
MTQRKTKEKPAHAYMHMCTTLGDPHPGQLYRLVTARQRMTDVSFALHVQAARVLRATQIGRTLSNPIYIRGIRAERERALHAHRGSLSTAASWGI